MIHADAVRPLNGAHPEAYAVDDAARMLRSGGLIMFPADTVYMMGTLPRVGSSASPGVERLYSLKARPRTQAFPWLVRDWHDLDVFGVNNCEDAYTLALAFWPGPLALVVQASSAVPRVLRRWDGTISLRMSAHPFVAGLIGAIGKPLVVSGANTHGLAAPRELCQIESHLIEACDITFDSAPDLCPGPATIVDCSEGEAYLIREGCVPAALIAQVVGHRV